MLSHGQANKRASGQMGEWAVGLVGGWAGRLAIKRRRGANGQAGKQTVGRAGWLVNRADGLAGERAGDRRTDGQAGGWIGQMGWHVNGRGQEDG